MLCKHNNMYEDIGTDCLEIDRFRFPRKSYKRANNNRVDRVFELRFKYNIVFCPCIHELIDNKGTAMNHPRTIRYAHKPNNKHLLRHVQKQSTGPRRDTRMFVYLWLVPPSRTAANITCTLYVSNYKWKNKNKSFSMSKL